jgi:hypothetical protein
MTSKWSKAFWLDLGERVASTFLGALLAYLVTDNTLEKVDFDQLWPVIVLPTLVSLIKGLLANLASPESGASLIKAPPGPVEVNRRNELGYGAIELVVGVILVIILVVLLLRIL